MKDKLESSKVIKEKKLIRKEYLVSPKWGMPILKKIKIPDEKIDFIAYDEISKNETSIENLHKTVHFFIDDGKFRAVYESYNISQLKKLAQYKYVLTPDFSVRVDMPLPIQIYNVFRSRWCGAHWQNYNIKVIPTISWSDERSYEFCFDGIEKGSTVAISTLGCKKSERLFMKGYNAMLKTIEPELIICYDSPFKEMEGNIKHIEYIYQGEVLIMGGEVLNHH
ncbi:conserved hypothetical protein [[Clostridium] ultunense Esp]|nr:conserved hypothetical protein [[Clostridium] ultunense Esp]